MVESALATWLRRCFIPQSLRDRVKQNFRMSKRPHLVDEDLARLTAEFDRDLDQLGSWLGIELNCQNFKQVTAASSLDWKYVD